MTRAKKKSARAVYWLGMIAVAGFTFVSGVAFAHYREPESSSTGVDASQPSRAGEEVAAPPISVPENLRPGGYADVAALVMPSVVNLSATRIRQRVSRGPMFGPLSPFFGRPYPGFGPQGRMPSLQRENSLGSGVIVREDGYILTNNHVVEGADEIRVELPGHRMLEATIVGSDEASDLTLLHVDATDLPAIAMGDSSQLRVGDVVMAVGNPFGVGQTVTMGIVSATGRANMGINDYEDFIQTDAAINPGNSGGALVNLRGELVGINSVIVSRSGGFNGLGFAIPSNMAQSISDSLRENGHVVRGWLGVLVQDPTPELAHGLGFDESLRGAVVSDVSAGSPGERAGLRSGDVITQVDNDIVSSAGELRSVIASHGAGTNATLSIIRANRPMNIDVTLGELHSSGGVNNSVQVDGSSMLAGVSVAAIPRDGQRAPSGMRRSPFGVMVTSVAPNSPAEHGGLMPGDIIVEINQRRLSSPEDFQRIAAAAQSEVVLLINRGGHAMFLAWR